MIVDPRNPDRLFVAALGHPYGPNQERGIFRSTDGGKTFEKVLYKDENTGGGDVAFDPINPDIVYGVLWEARQGPWENGDFRGPGSGLFKSTDGGTTWRPLTKGLPTWDGDRLGRIGITVAPSLPSRLYATVEAQTLFGIYRSDDAGESWTRVNGDERVVARPYDSYEVRVHPTNPDIVYVPTIVAWKSTATRDAHGAVLLLSATDAIRKRVVRRDVVELRRRLVVPTAPRLPAVQRDNGPLIRSQQHDVRRLRVDGGIGAPNRCRTSRRKRFARPVIALFARCPCCSRRSIRGSSTSPRTWCGKR